MKTIDPQRNMVPTTMVQRFSIAVDSKHLKSQNFRPGDHIHDIIEEIQ